MKDNQIVRESEEAEIVILFCPAAKKLADLVQVAAEQLEKIGFGKILSMEHLVDGYSESSRVLLVESGYEDSFRDVLLQKQIRLDHHLILKDLGLEEDAEPDDANVELVKDGIIAECVVIDSQTPKFNCPCCG